MLKSTQTRSACSISTSGQLRATAECSGEILPRVRQPLPNAPRSLLLRVRGQTPLLLKWWTGLSWNITLLPATSNYNSSPHFGGHNQTKDVLWCGILPTLTWMTPTEDTFVLPWDLSSNLEYPPLWCIFQSYCKLKFFAKLLLLPKTSLLLADTVCQKSSWANKGVHFLLQSWSDYLANQPDTPSLTCFQCQCI